MRSFADFKIVIAIVAIGFGLTPFLARALPGDLNEGFGNGGKARAAMLGGSVTVRTAARQSDGKIVVAASCIANTGIWSFCISRFNADGSFSNSVVNVLGSRTWHPVDQSGAAIPYAIAIDPVDRIVIAGQCVSATRGGDFCVVRFLRDGLIDTSFGVDGAVVTAIEPSIANEYATALAIQPDGKVLAGGVCTRGGINVVAFCMVRYLANGGIDSSFGTNGIAAQSFLNSPANTTDLLYALALDEQGTIYAAGGCQQPSSTVKHFCAMRFTQTGSVLQRRSYGVGVVGSSYVRAIAFQADGNLVMSGTCNSGAATGIDFCTVRVNANLDLDPSFGGAIVRTPIAFQALDDAVSDVAIQPDGRIVVGGSCGLNPATSGDGFCWARYVASGDQDRSINGNADTTGVIVTEFNANASNDRSASTLLTEDGGIILVGSCEQSVGSNQFDMCAAKYQGGPFLHAYCSPDIDGDGRINPLIDGLIIARIALGLRDSAVIGGIQFPPSAVRQAWNNSNGIAFYLARRCGVQGLSYVTLSTP
jgi:uncharacterized delta-60 repeat protein